MVDVYEWDHEESTTQRENGKKKSLEMIGASNKGNVGMVKQILRKDAREKRQHRCYGAIFWFSMKQDRAQNTVPYTN